MSITCYTASLTIAVLNLVLTFIVLFSNADSTICRVYGDKEVIFCLVISIILLIIGFICDKK